MQPPPQTGPPGAFGSSRMPMTTNAYWRKRAPPPAPVTTASVQPVTDPFAFGHMTSQNMSTSNTATSQNMLASNAPRGGLLGMASASPSLYPQPLPASSSAGDGAHGGQGSVSQPVSKGAPFAGASGPPAGSGYFTNNAPPRPSAQSGHGHLPPQPFHYMASGLENAYLPSQNRSQSRQGHPPEQNNSGAAAAASLSFVPTPPQQSTGPWVSMPGPPPTSVQNFAPPAQASVYNAPYSSPDYLEVSNLPPQSVLLPNDPAYAQAPQRVAPTQFPGNANYGVSQGASQFSSMHQMDYMHSHNPEQNSWYKQPYEEQMHPPLVNPTAATSGTQSSGPENRPQGEYDKASSSHNLPDTDSGTISMFFKGDEAENVEIISSEQHHAFNIQSHDASHFQNTGHMGGVPSSQSQSSGANTPSQPPVASGPSSPNSQSLSTQNSSSTQDSQSARAQDVYSVGSNVALAIVDPQYENVENIECVQNLEVLPNEPNISLFPPSVSSDLFRYGQAAGPTQVKNAVNPTEGGPNLETLDCSSRPARSDSVSSGYSNLSHRSLPASNRPQELVGTFIQKESGKLDNDPANGFFKQVDSSPLGGDAGGQNMGQNAFHANTSHPPTPSPPKPTGLFQTSANSSFEPVRSHAVGLKPAEVDQAKGSGDVREHYNLLPSASHGVSIPAASPGNMEHPPDNMETIFTDNSNLFTANSANVFKPMAGPSFESISSLLEKRPSSRAHGSNKKCESPATTLWAQGELPNFGGNVLLAPAAPVLYAPAKSQAEVIQPPEDGLPEPQPGRQEVTKFQATPEERIPSENLENPPKIGEDEQVHSQASSGYASLLSSPPTETLQNQPVLIAPPNKSYNLLQPINFSLSLPNQARSVNSGKDSSAEDKRIPSSGAPTTNLNSDQSAPLSLIQSGQVIDPPLLSISSNNKSAPGVANFHEPFPNQALNVPMSSSTNQVPLNLVTEGQKTMKVENTPFDFGNKSSIPVSVSTGSNLPPRTGNGVSAPPVTSSVGSINRTNSQVETTGALDFTVPRAPANHNASNGANVVNHPPAGGPVQSVNTQNYQPGPDINKQGFYRQVTGDARSDPQRGQETSHVYMAPASQPTPASASAQITSGAKPQQGEKPVPGVPQQTSLLPNSSGAPEPASQYGPSEPLPHSIQHTAATSAPVNLNHTAGYAEPPRPPPSHTPQQADPYYYYRGYNAYPPAYPQQYPPVDPRSHMYYQDAYAAYDPSYRQYPGKYPYPEPERPSSRSSHCSDRPSSRQGYSAKGEWSAPNSYYPDYYQSQYEYGDPARWDRYPGAYDPGYRDPRSNYWSYMYRSQEDPYQRKAPYAYTSRYDVYEDRWQYDPRYVGGFDEENEPQRDLAKDDFDRRSVHSEHSARSLHSGRSAHSRRSSFSSHSQHSQIYKSQHDLTANAYDPQFPNPPPAEYPYGVYPNDYTNQQSMDTYPYGYQTSTEWQPVEQVPSRPVTPEKFGSPHVCARFGPGGFLIKVLPNLPSDGQPTLVEIHTMEVIMQNSVEREQLRSFPGPLVKDETHKVDVINFAQSKAKECSQNEGLLDQESARLLWDFVVLLCRQNGTVVGTDIAELLLREHKTVWLPGKSPDEANLIDFTNEALEQEEESGASQLSFLADMLPSEGKMLEKETERFRELLLFGRKKDALETAMKHGLWGHALLLASKMDSRTHSRVMTRFANSLPINDPLQTVYQLLSGRMPAAANSCGDEKWGDWRPHLAMVLSNITNNLEVPTRTMTTMGDTLASRGLLEAAHFCYLMAQVGFGFYTKKTTKLVLIGSNHSLPFTKFATNEAIQRTEAYEYAQSLGTQTISLPNIQVFKFVYACRLAESGLSAQAFHYCEVIAKTVLKHPSYYSPVLVGQLLEVSSHLRFFDPQLKEKPEQEMFIEPSWLLRLRHLDMQMKQGTVVYNTGRSTPQQYACSTPSSEMDHVSQTDGMAAPHDAPVHTDNQLLATFLPSMMPEVQGVQLATPGPENPPFTYQPPVASEPSYPGTPQSVAPASAFPPPVSGQGFVPYSDKQPPAYTAPVTSPLMPPTPQPIEYPPQEQWSQDPGVQMIPQGSPTKMVHDSGFDFYGEMAKMAPGQRSRTVSQSSLHMRRTRTTSESSTHSIGSGRRSSVGMQPSPPPPSIPEVDRQEPKKESKAHTASQGGGKSWFPLKIGWLMGKGKSEAHLPDDKNKSIVWDEKKQRWVNMDEPDGEENKPPPPPPSTMPKRPQNIPPGPGGPPNPSVNMFSIRAAGTRGRYVDVLNPSGSRPSNPVPPPADLFAPLAPMPMPANLFVPNAVPEPEQPMEASGAETAQPGEPTGYDAQSQLSNTASFPPGADVTGSNEESPPGELSRSSSMSSLSREVSQHFTQAPVNTAPVSAPPAGTVTFYNPSNFAQRRPPSAAAGGARPGRLGQRKYPTLK
ncbi:protein transport protein Sec16A [Spea bombifrons]|uniref:protein transport protein Sec16A n=1 Tax=Spea bombifrons TaxID=233779 RepID=UPI00234B65BD|nr:protein transport protein Sec16A [Spea bombifrons]